MQNLGAPKGIRILKVLVTIGTTWDSLVLKSCGATSRQVVYEALCSDLELLAQPTMSAGTTS